MIPAESRDSLNTTDYGQTMDRLWTDYGQTVETTIWLSEFKEKTVFSM